ncbi:MAG TPA: hypothetical protein VK211_11705 [Kamptonema sp.]|nr:hypothetical protein [Kamptonema sp.]
MMSTLKLPEKYLEIKHAYSSVLNIKSARLTGVQIVNFPTGISVASSQKWSQYT